jgi:hypothetical protein
MDHISWTEHAACQWNGQAHVLSAMNAKASVAQRRHVRFRPMAYAAHSCHVAASGLRLSGEQECMRICPDPTRPGLDTCRQRTPAWALIKVRVCSVLEPWDPTVSGPNPIREGSGSHSRGLVHTRGGPGSNLEVQTVYLGVRHSPMGVRTHC